MPENKSDSIADFPLMPSEKQFHTKMDPKLAKPKKSKLTPKLLDAIARVQGVKRTIYKSKEEKEIETFKSLQKEIIEICAALKKADVSDIEKQEIKGKLFNIIKQMQQLDAKYTKKYSDFK